MTVKTTKTIHCDCTCGCTTSAAYDDKLTGWGEIRVGDGGVLGPALDVCPKCVEQMMPHAPAPAPEAAPEASA